MKRNAIFTSVMVLASLAVAGQAFGQRIVVYTNHPRVQEIYRSRERVHENRSPHEGQIFPMYCIGGEAYLLDAEMTLWRQELTTNQWAPAGRIHETGAIETDRHDALSEGDGWLFGVYVRGRMLVTAAESDRCQGSIRR
jgi:hypothetical protein